MIDKLISIGVYATAGIVALVLGYFFTQPFICWVKTGCTF